MSGERAETEDILVMYLLWLQIWRQVSGLGIRDSMERSSDSDGGGSSYMFYTLLLLIWEL